MRVLILGGDGYLGWPTAMHLSACGHDVWVVDNYLRRQLALETNMEFLHPVASLHERCRLWEAHSGFRISPRIADLADWEVTEKLFSEFSPEAVVHYAEQPSAPYSMMSRKAAARTLHNNVGVTLNVIHAMREHAPGSHLIKLGTMGEYGTPNIDIEEGWLEVEHRGRKDKFLFPRQAGSLYHTTKIMDTDLLWFYVRVWGLRATDLMQGPVYGIDTEESEDDERLAPYFSYDELFGTVLNRFVAQAVAGYPLTVYGTGGQTRGYLNLRDVVQCVRLALDSPPEPNELRILNQFTETFTVNQLAEKVQRAGGRAGIKVSIKALQNPREELEDHYYHPRHTGLLDLGLVPTLLGDEVLDRMISYVQRHRDRIKLEQMFRGTRWR